MLHFIQSAALQLRNIFSGIPPAGMLQIELQHIQLLTSEQAQLWDEWETGDNTEHHSANGSRAMGTMRLLFFWTKNQEYTPFIIGKIIMKNPLQNAAIKKYKMRMGTAAYGVAFFSNNRHSSRHPVLQTLMALQHSCWRQGFQTWEWSAVMSNTSLHFSPIKTISNKGYELCTWCNKGPAKLITKHVSFSVRPPICRLF